MSNQKLAADPNALILGIISVLFVFGGCCCGLAVIPALGMSIYGLVLANKSLKEFADFPESFERQSLGNVKAARIVNIIALVLSALGTLVYLGYFIFFGAALSTGILEGLDASQYSDDYIIEKYDDSVEVWDLEAETAPVLQDSTAYDSIAPRTD